MILEASRGLYQFPPPRSDQKELIASDILLVFINFHLGERCSRLAQQGVRTTALEGRRHSVEGIQRVLFESFVFQEPRRLPLRTKV
jgi:hypothetical protein